MNEFFPKLALGHGSKHAEGGAAEEAFSLYQKGEMCYHGGMIEIRSILRLFDSRSLIKGMLLLLLYSLVPIGELALLLYLGQRWGTYLVLALTAGAGLFGFIVSVRKVRRMTEQIKARVAEGCYPGDEFVRLAGALVGSLLLITPGFITDIIGFLLLFTFPQVWVGRSITRRMEDKLKEVYEYLKL